MKTRGCFPGEDCGLPPSVSGGNRRSWSALRARTPYIRWANTFRAPGHGLSRLEPLLGGIFDRIGRGSKIPKIKALHASVCFHERKFLLSIVHYIFIHVSEFPKGAVDAKQIAKTTCQKEYYKFPFEKGHFLKHRRG